MCCVLIVYKTRPVCLMSIPAPLSYSRTVTVRPIVP